MYFGRGKRQIIADYTSVDVYKFYKEKFGEKALTKKQFSVIWNRFIDVRLQMVIFENVQFTMPHRMGEISIRLGAQANKITKKGKFHFKTNWGETKKRWKEMYPNLSGEEIKKIPNKPLVYVSNDTTDGRKVYWRWDKMTCNYKNNTVYRIRMNRRWSRMLSSYVQKTEKIQYYENNR
jgi:hypothetical protein